MTRVSRVAAVALTLLAAACSDAPVAPQTKPQFSAAQSNAVQHLARYRKGPPSSEAAFAMKSIGPTGGTLSLAGFQVDVPAGAVTERTNFTIQLPVDPSVAEYVWASFGPHGLKFNVPVTLTVPVRGTTSEGCSDCHVLWFDGARWVQLATTPTADGRLQTKTTHFSDYGTETADTVARGITLAGT